MNPSNQKKTKQRERKKKKKGRGMAKQDSNCVQIQIGEMDTKENDEKFQQIPPTKVETDGLSYNPSTGNLAGKLAKLAFSVHLFILAILITFLALSGFLENHTFHPTHFYIPLAASIFSSVITAAAWLFLALRHPEKALKTSLWLCSLLVCATGVLLLAVGTALSLAIASLALASALSLALYACWASPRIEHSCQILSTAIAAVPPCHEISKFVATGIVVAVAYGCFWISGVTGVAAKASDLNPLYVFVLLSSLAWTMNVIKNTTQVAISRIAFMRLAHGMDTDAAQAFGDASTRAFPSVCLGSAAAPALEAFRAVAKAMDFLAGGTDEFLFSCTRCYASIANEVVAWGNRWGFVHVGVHNKGFVMASRDAWEVFVKQGMVEIVDMDLAGGFCFMCGVAGGAVAGVVGGCWVLAVEKEYATGVAIYAFLIGYFINRVAVAWPEACVTAYHVAYAENPQNQRLGSAIADWIKKLQSSPA